MLEWFKSPQTKNKDSEARQPTFVENSSAKSLSAYKGQSGVIYTFDKTTEEY
jgi:hypothetical protein